MYCINGGFCLCPRYDWFIYLYVRIKIFTFADHEKTVHSSGDLHRQVRNECNRANNRDTASLLSRRGHRSLPWMLTRRATPQSPASLAAAVAQQKLYFGFWLVLEKSHENNSWSLFSRPKARLSRTANQQFAHCALFTVQWQCIYCTLLRQSECCSQIFCRNLVL